MAVGLYMSVKTRTLVLACTDVRCHIDEPRSHPRLALPRRGTQDIRRRWTYPVTMEYDTGNRFESRPNLKVIYRVRTRPNSAVAPF